MYLQIILHLFLLTSFISTERNNDAEIISTFDMYFSALVESDIDTALEYLYPYFEKWLIDEYSDQFTVSELREGQKEMISEGINQLINAGISLDYESNSVRHIHSNETSYVYEVHVTLIATRGSRTEKLDDYYLAIKHSDSDKWTFLQAYPPITPQILGYRFNRDEIRHVMQTANQSTAN